MGLGQINRAQYNHSLSNEPKAKTNIAIIFNNIATQLFQLNTRVKKYFGRYRVSSCKERVFFERPAENRQKVGNENTFIYQLAVNGCSYELKACVDLVLQLADNACKGL